MKGPDWLGALATRPAAAGATTILNQRAATGPADGAARVSDTGVDVELDLTEFFHAFGSTCVKVILTPDHAARLGCAIWAAVREARANAHRLA